MTDRYTKLVLTVIAGALIYLCVVMTPFPAAHAQGTRRAGEMIDKPIEAVIVGWKANEPMPISTTRPLQVQTERSAGGADRVVIVGWEENSARERTGAIMVPFLTNRGQALPVKTFP